MKPEINVWFNLQNLKPMSNFCYPPANMPSKSLAENIFRDEKDVIIFGSSAEIGSRNSVNIENFCESRQPGMGLVIFI